MFFVKQKVPRSYHLINNPKKLSWLRDELLRVSEFSFDIETNHPTSKARKIKVPEGFKEVLSGISFSWNYQESTIRKSAKPWWRPGTAAYVPLHTSEDAPFWKGRQDKALSIVQDILRSPASKIAQNGKFDLRKLAELEDMQVVGFDFDVMLAHILLDEERLFSSHALKSEYNKEGNLYKLGMSDAYLDTTSGQFKDDLSTALDFYDSRWRRYSKVPLDILYPYGCADSDMTLALKHVFQPMLEAEGLTWGFETLSMPLANELVRMELHGVPVLLDVVRQVIEEQGALMKDTEGLVYQLCGKEFKIGSDKELGKVLFEELGLVGKKNDNHQWVTDADAIRAVEHPVAEPVLKWKRAQKILSSYAIPALENVQEITNEGKVGWVHPSFFAETVTGRLTMSNPTLNVLPRPENGGGIVKSMYAGGSDYRFIFKDYSQIELKVVAHLSQEPVWIESFRNKYDMHAAMAQRIWHPECPIEQIKELHSPSRSNAKTVNFGIIYGQTIFALAEKLNITVEEADKLVNEDYFGAAPVLKAWIDATHEFAETYGYVTSMFGRRRHLPDALLHVPVAPPKPHYGNRPTCFMNGPNLEGLGLEYDEVPRISEYDLGVRIRQTGRDFLYKCIKCHCLHSCISNREVRKLKGAYNRAMRQSVNAPVQSSAAEMTSLAMVLVNGELRNRRLDAMAIMNTHDEIAVYSHTSCVDEACQLMDYYMVDYMTELFNFSVPLSVDTAVVYCMAEKHDHD
jgi:DNA polymerase I-like protein with 3'-5' exonuclease and polymerase domains